MGGYLEVAKRYLAKATALILCVTSAGFAIVLGGPVARAGTGPCPSPSYQFVYDEWSPTDGDIAGMRSPIQLRRTGDVCSPSGVLYEWVGTYNSATVEISQIGWAHYLPLGFCRFTYWASSGSSSGVDFSRCGSDPAGTIRPYKIEETSYPSGDYRYSIYDCGTSGWGELH